MSWGVISGRGQSWEWVDRAQVWLIVVGKKKYKKNDKVK